jgi:hypothetical protein
MKRTDARCVLAKLPMEIRLRCEWDLLLYGNAYVIKHADGTFEYTSDWKREWFNKKVKR